MNVSEDDITQVHITRLPGDLQRGISYIAHHTAKRVVFKTQAPFSNRVQYNLKKETATVAKIEEKE